MFINIFRSRQAYSSKTTDISTTSSYTVQMPEPSRSEADREREYNKILTTKSPSLLSPKKIDLNSSKKPDREKASVDGDVEKSIASSVTKSTTSFHVSASATKTTDTVSRQQSSSTKSTNVFSARGLGVVSPVKEMMTNDKDKMVRKFGI